MAKSQPECCSQCKVIKSEAEKTKAKLDEMKKHIDAFKTLANKKTTAGYNSMVEVLVQNFEDILDNKSDTVKTLDIDKEPNEKKTTPTRNLKRKLPLTKINKDGSTRPKVVKTHHSTPSNAKKYLLKSSGGITTVKRPAAAMIRVSGRARRTSYKDFILPYGAAKKQKSNSNNKVFTSKKNHKIKTEVSEDEEVDFDDNQDQSNLSRSRRVITPNKKFSSYVLNPSIKKQRFQNNSHSSSFFETSGKSSPSQESIKRGRGRPKKHFSDEKTTKTTNKLNNIKQEPGLSDSKSPIKIKSEPKSPLFGKSRSPKIPVSQSNEIKVIKLTNSSRELNKFDLDSDSPELVVFVRSKRTSNSSPSSQKFL